MSLEIQDVEFTVEDLLNFHRGWITQLYMGERKTELEIVEMLYERRLCVSISQIQVCINEWGLVPPDISTLSLNETTEHTGDTQPSSANASYSPSDPDSIMKYISKPLPSIPDTKASVPGHIRQDSITIDNLKLSCPTSSSPAHLMEADTSLPLECESSGPSPIELYADDEQNHERVAMGLERLPVLDYRRANGSHGRRGGEEVRMRTMGRATFRKRKIRVEVNGETKKRSPSPDEE